MARSKAYDHIKTVRGKHAKKKRENQAQRFYRRMRKKSKRIS